MKTIAARRRVLVATDLSDTSGEALTQAHVQARAMGGQLGVCHVLPSSGVHMLFPQRYATEALQEAELEERVRGILLERTASVTGRPQTAFEVFVEHGTDYAEIVRRAEAWDASMIVVGSHGRTGVGQRLLGSVAEKVVRYAHCPVLVARQPARRGIVLCATGLSAPALPAVVAAVAEARFRRAKLAVLHVVDQGVPLGIVGPSEGITPLVPSPELLTDLRQRAHAELDAVLARLEAQAEVTVVEGHAAAVILRYVEEHSPELVVMGTRGRTGLARIALGSVAEHVVRDAGTSVLVVRLVPRVDREAN